MKMERSRRRVMVTLLLLQASLLLGLNGCGTATAPSSGSRIVIWKNPTTYPHDVYYKVLGTQTYHLLTRDSAFDQYRPANMDSGNVAYSAAFSGEVGSNYVIEFFIQPAGYPKQYVDYMVIENFEANVGYMAIPE